MFLIACDTQSVEATPKGFGAANQDLGTRCVCLQAPLENYAYVTSVTISPRDAGGRPGDRGLFPGRFLFQNITASLHRRI